MSTKPRARTARAAANDAAIALAAVDEVLRAGVDRVSLRETALRAGLTHGATYARYEDVSELLIDVWRSRLVARAIDLFEMCVRAAEKPSEETLGLVFGRVRDPQPEDVVMIETLLVARRLPILYEEVGSFVNNYLHPDDELTANSRALFERSLTLFGVVMFSLFGGHYFDADHSYLDVLERVLLTTLRNGSTDATAGETTEVGMNAPDSDEDLRERLQYTTYSFVGNVGYHEATMTRIARRAECSPGAIYKLYRSKEQLVLDSFRAALRRQWTASAGFGHTFDSELIPTLLSCAASRRNAALRKFAMEASVAAAHNDILRDTVGGDFDDPGELAKRFASSDEISTKRMLNFVRAMSSLANGAGWMATVTSAESPDVEQLVEAFRVNLVDEWQRSDGIEEGLSVAT